MNQRDRNAAGGIALIAPPETDTSQPGTRSPSESPVATLSWDQFIDRLSSEQRRHLMHLANSQGMVLAAQLPDTTSLTGPDGKPRTLGQLLNLDFRFLAPLPLLSDSRPTNQRAEALGFALENPDLLLIQCLPRTGKSALVREIVESALARKWRVLYLGSSSAADRLVQQWPDDGPARIRCLSRDERLDQLSPAIANFTLVQREKSIQQAAIERSRKNLQTAQDCDSRLRELEATAARLEATLSRLPEVRIRLAAATSRRESLAAEVALSQSQGDSELAHRLTQLTQDCEVRCGEKVAERDRLREECRQCERELEEAATQVDQVRTLCEAKQGGRWWSASFWKAKFEKSLPEKSVHLEEIRQHLTEAIQSAKSQLTTLDAEIDAAYRERDNRVRQAIDEELHRRTVECDGELTLLRREETELAEAIQATRSRAAAALELSVESVASMPPDEVRKLAVTRLKENEQELLFAKRWNDFLQTEGESLVRQNRTAIPLVIGTFGSVQADPFFADPGVRNSPFDLLLLDEASQLHDADFNHAIARCKRVVLISEVDEPDLDGEKAAKSARGGSRYSVAPRKKADAFERLWKKCYTPPWTFEGKRLVAHLVPLTEEQLRSVERESVADNPQVELRIFTPEVGEPCLAAVAFAAGTTSSQAHQFLVSELGEVLAYPPLRIATWSDSPLSVRFGDLPSLEQISLSGGIRQWFNGFHTVGFDFDPDWSRDRSAAWVEEILAKHSPGKAIRIDSPASIDGAYARWLNDLFRIGYSAPPSTASVPPPVRFVKVPEKPVLRESANGYPGDRRPSSPRLSGAGLEIDLSDIRRRGELPPDWASVLPTQGLVNRAEAESLMAMLPSTRSDHADSVVGVSALTHAQICLLRYLVRKAGLSDSVKVIDPYRPEIEECDLLLLSLTRSHVSRAVTYGDHPRTIQRLLTHVRRGLILFGDMGTLSRRAGWEGACDQLDEEAGSRERDWVNMLLRYLHGKGPQPHLFQATEGARHDG